MNEERSQELAEKAVKLADLWIRKRLPWLGGALMVPVNEWLESDVSGTDGVRIFWNPDEVCRFFEESTAKLARRYLHLLLHGLYLHPLREEKGEEELWWLACDLMTEYRIDRIDVPGFLRPVPAERSRSYRKIREAGADLTEQGVAEWLLHLNKEQIRELEQTFRWDDHSCWRKDDEPEHHMERISERVEELKLCTEAVHRWRTVWMQASVQRQEHKRQVGGSAGGQSQMIRLKEDRQYDYREFLRKYAVWGETLSLDTDSFDYLPYDYSRRMYENLLLLEPLEYKEVRRLREFVIAIDTSGSCSGKVVRQFLSETWEIFRERENFFEHMNIHILQCDYVIQEHVRITCQEEWQEYVDHVEVKGHGDTDFTPVFRLVDKMIREKELTNLKGLLYFTDGDGIYPDWIPSYETAFVFLNQELKKGKAPDWAEDLTLGLEI